MNDILSIIGLLGIGGLISSYFTILWQRKNEESKAKQEYKETRYKCIVLLMKASIDFEKYKNMLLKYNYDVSNKADLLELLRDEQISSLLFASKGFIKSFGAFINNANKNNLVVVVNEMRKDLWKLKGDIDINDIA